MEPEVPEVMMELERPVLKKQVEVYLDIYPFRKGDHGGIDVTHCSEFLQRNGIPLVEKTVSILPKLKRFISKRFTNVNVQGADLFAYTL